MIARLQGVLAELDASGALIGAEGGLTYRVLLPAYTAGRLGGSIGQRVDLHTLYYIESQNQGATLLPRLVGFLTPQDRDFFELFTTCKGIGNRRALRAMAVATEQLAAAIADRDLATLQSLPEIGRRMAETIVATLHGKVDHFLVSRSFAVAAGSSQGHETSQRQGSVYGNLAREGLEVLLQLGENRLQAVTWIDQAMRDEKDRPQSVQDLVARVYRLKAGG